MSLIYKAIASTGVGSAKVDTYIQNQMIYNGGQVDGYVNISGGKIEQKVTSVFLVLMTFVDIEEENYEKRKSIELSRFNIARDTLIKPNETITIPFSIVIPNDTPVSFKDDMIWFETSLDIKMAIDPTNKTYIKVKPHSYIQHILDILQKDLKFILTGIENIYVPNNGSHLPIVQIFDFSLSSPLIDKLNEMKVMFFVDDLRGLEILLEFPQKSLISKEHIHKYSSIYDNKARIFIPKNELINENNCLSDLLLHNIKKNFSST